MEYILRRLVWVLGPVAGLLVAGVLATVSARFWSPHQNTSTPGETFRSHATVHTSMQVPVVQVYNGSTAHTPAPATGRQPTLTPVSAPSPPETPLPQLPEVKAGDMLMAQRTATTPAFPDTPLGRHVQSHIRLIEGRGPEAEERYQASVQALREHPEAAMALLSSAYAQLATSRYLDRWKIVDTLSALRSHVALEALSRIAHEPMPEDHAPNTHGFSARAEEIMIRGAAIRGIAALVQRGIADAEATLHSLVRSPETAVREMATLAYLRTGGDRQQRLNELRALLDPQDHWILQLQHLSDVRVMPQPTPLDGRPAMPSPDGRAGQEPGTGRAGRAQPAKVKAPPPQGD